MGAHPASVNFEPVIWARLIRTPKEPISPEAARYLLSIDFSGADRSRMQELMDKSNEGTLTSMKTLNSTVTFNIANVLSAMHSRARVALRYSGFEGSRDDRIL
jgi:hypothetical protein